MNVLGFPIKAAVLAAVSACFFACSGPVPMDVVMVDNELCFVLEKAQEIGAVWVSPYDQAAGEKGGAPVWLVRHDLTTPVEGRKYPKLKQIKYGQEISGLTVFTGPGQLQKNTEYLVGLDMGGKFAREVFMLTDENNVVRPRGLNAR